MLWHRPSSVRGMRVGIDCTALARRRAGLELYVQGLARALVQLDRDVEFVLFLPRSGPEELAELQERARIIRSPFNDSIVRSQLWLSLAARSSGVNLMHYPAYPPLWPAPPFVMTVQDVTPWLFPQTMPRKGYAYFRSLLAVWTRKARLVITGSEASRIEIARMFGLPEASIKVIYHGVRSALLAGVGDSSRLLARFGLAPGYILFVGTVEPRKNLRTLIRALSRLRTGGLYVKLVVAGRMAWGATELLNVIEEEHVGDLVVVTGYVSDDELACLYRNASFVVQPSVYEGFGLPVVEAMALGCPVIASRIPAHVEVLGETGMYFSPLDIEGLSNAMVQLLADNHVRAGLVEAGLRRSQEFTWERAARQTREAYYEAIQRSTV